MKNSYYAYLAFACLIVSACTATPAGKLTPNDFYSKTFAVNDSVDQARNNLLNGIRTCGHETGKVFNVIHHGRPDCLPKDNQGGITCDLYIDIGNAGNDYVSGRIIFEPIERHKTEATIGAIKRFAKKDRMINAWHLFIQGRENKVCSGTDKKS